MVTHDQKLEHFRFRVEQLCSWAAAAPGDPRADVERATRVLAGLVYSGSRLKDDGCQIFTSEPESPRNQERLIERFRRLPSECAPLQGVTRFCPARNRSRGLAYCLIEIHNELVAGLRLYNEGNRAAARSQWRFGFVHSWGKLAICALFVLHSSMQEAASSDADRPERLDPAHTAC
jgi:hypothetical protein